MRYKAPPLPLRLLAFFLAIVTSCIGFSALSQLVSTPTQNAQNQPTYRKFTVVIDAGHGGEDGGAVSASGVTEKEINLKIAFQLKALLQANGIDVVMTRQTDILLYDKSGDYQGRKKALDLAARRKIAEETEDAVFVSIHLNAYPEARYSGLQVWYSPNAESSAFWAKTLQNAAKFHLQPQNERQVKAATDGIYLLHRLTSPAILVECGFLSNPEEAERLATEEYQRELAFLIFYSILASEGEF